MDVLNDPQMFEPFKNLVICEGEPDVDHAVALVWASLQHEDQRNLQASVDQSMSDPGLSSHGPDYVFFAPVTAKS